jgi:hypothetical protein
MRYARENDIHLYSDYAADCFEELIIELHRKTGKKVVVLVDEYDAPIFGCHRQIKQTNQKYQD